MNGRRVAPTTFAHQWVATRSIYDGKHDVNDVVKEVKWTIVIPYVVEHAVTLSFPNFDGKVLAGVSNALGNFGG